MSKNQIGRWIKTGNPLGGGGQSQVYRVRDATGTLTGEFALKLLTNIKRSGRLETEISTTRELFQKGAAVLEIIDDYITAQDNDNKPWYVAPIANRGCLRDQMQAGSCFGNSAQVALTTFAQIMKAVLSLHDNEVAHRDLKPENILLNDKQILLGDLGLCLPLHLEVTERQTADLERIGSIHYMPKEALSKQEIGRKQLAYDAYALGKILYELLAGKPLPGFESHTTPKYNLCTNNHKTIYPTINALLVNLLHDDPNTRLYALQKLPRQIEVLIAWEKEFGPGEPSRGSTAAVSLITQRPVGGLSSYASLLGSALIREYDEKQEHEKHYDARDLARLVPELNAEELSDAVEELGEQGYLKVQKGGSLSTYRFMHAETQYRLYPQFKNEGLPYSPDEDVMAVASEIGVKKRTSERELEATLRFPVIRLLRALDHLEAQGYIKAIKSALAP